MLPVLSPALLAEYNPAMRSPFPGMDPFLESPSQWSEFHARFIYELAAELGDNVDDNFGVHIEKRVYLVEDNLWGDGRGFQAIPNVMIERQRTIAPATSTQTMATVSEPTYIERFEALEVHEWFIEIRETRNRDAIAVIELVSPFNKTAGTRGIEDFNGKRNAVMASRTHWIEIDLLRNGARLAEVENKSDYYALLKRAVQPHDQFAVWFFDLRDKMPTIAVPLRLPYDDIALELQTVFDRTNERAHYARHLDYSADIPMPRLSVPMLRWVGDQLQQWQQNH